MNAMLIANRGEIAVRIARTCRDLGIRAIAVHSDVDAGALHVATADDAVHLPGASASDTYLCIEAVIRAAAAAGADAVHPGYGFLAENADFAAAVIESGLAWVGPPERAIVAMGDKVVARRTAFDAGARVVPGTSDPLTGPSDVIEFGAEHGWPIAVKAAAGGGGRGMRVIAEADEADRMVAAAAREALAAFGDDRLYLERYLSAPRHLEVQVLADAHGTIVAIGDRDCSVQRRHQKLIEEAPAAALEPDARRELVDAAVAVAHAVGYVGAGTVEFLYEEGRSYFLEMNTRLQVEHTVTEAVTGLDLVAEQIRIADGEPLSTAVRTAQVRGHAIELRLNAEDPAGGAFVPSPGPIARLAFPDGPGIRVDTGYRAGDTVSDRYDNLIAKLVIWGPDRPSCVRRALRAVGELEVAGIATTAPALEAVLAHPDFAVVAHTTPWLEAHREILPAPSSATVVECAVAESEALDSTVIVNGRRYWLPLGRRAPVVGDERSQPAPPPASPQAARPRANGDAERTPAATASRASTAGAVEAPMQGRVIAVAVAVGDRVVEGQVICVMEAMKMEQEIVAESAGEVTHVQVGVGDSVGPGQVLAVVEP